MYWEEFDAHQLSFRDPWGNEIVLWRNKGTYVPGSESDTNKDKEIGGEDKG